MIIDFHTHNFPDALAERAMASLIKTNSSLLKMEGHTDGTARGARELLSKAGISRAVVCNIATNARQESNVNSYAISLISQGDFFSPLGSVHPDSENKERELDRVYAVGIRGIKLHPDYVRIPLADSRYDEIFSLLEERDMFAVVHTGFDPVSPDFVHATPDMLLEVIKKHTRLKLVAAHMGGLLKAEEVLQKLVGTSIYIDTSLSSLRIDEHDAIVKILKEHDEDRILFGTDTPWSDPKKEIELVATADISERRREKIFSNNAIKLLGLE